MKPTPLQSVSTLTALMEANRGIARSISYLESEHEAHSIAYGELYERALAILRRLQRLGARAGDKVILLLSGNEPFIDAFWAAVLGGIVPVPVAPGISDEHRHKLLRIARKLGTPYLYTEQRLLDRIEGFASEHGEHALYESLRSRAFLVDELDELRGSGKVHRASPSDPAFIQFSSGSTAEPKGVVLTHENLIANIRGSTEIAHFGPEDVSLSWMPLTHDMGLIGFHLVMFANRVQSHLMPTELFVRRPLLWLQFASRVRASILCSPNFGYRHYLKVLAQRPIEGLDLSSVRLLFNGAEPISVELVEEFLARLAPAGLAREAMYPVYGLAEASLAVSFPVPRAPLHTASFDRHRLGVGAEPRLLPPAERDALQLVSVGRAIPYCELRIAADDDAVLPAERVGHIQIRGGNVTRGYFEDPGANAAAFSADGWLRTGDLGVIHAGELYITGRHKEILFVNGQNYYPHDLERIAEAVAGLELGKVVIAGVRRPGATTDELVVFVLHRAGLEEFAALARAVARRLGEQAGLEVHAVVPVRRIPKTTSGKIQRHSLEQEYLAGAYDTELAELARLAAARPVAPSEDGEIERQLLSLCEGELEGRKLEVDENLFDIGASSLKLIAIHERIERRWPGLIELPDMFEHPSVRELAALIARKLESAAV
jgi:acyl-CoA synthetase (AMP-forming)/AMP-acid ligase II/aryl carrier-like protein